MCIYVYIHIYIKKIIALYNFNISFRNISDIKLFKYFPEIKTKRKVNEPSEVRSLVTGSSRAAQIKWFGYYYSYQAYGLLDSVCRMQLWEISRNWSHLIVWPLPQNIFKTLAFRFSPAPYNIYCLSVWTKSSFDILGFRENSENCLNSLMCRCWDTLIKWSPDGQTERQAVLLAFPADSDWHWN